MKFTFEWLKDHLETDRPLADIIEKLSMIGLEVEGVEDRAEALASSALRMWCPQRNIPTPTGWSAWLTTATVIRCRWYAAHQTRGPA